MARRFPEMDRGCAEQLVKEILNSMANALARGDRIELRGFGTFGVKELEPRTGRNPKTGIAVAVPERRRAFFRAGKLLRESVQAAADANNLRRP